MDTVYGSSRRKEGRGGVFLGVHRKLDFKRSFIPSLRFGPSVLVFFSLTPVLKYKSFT